MRSYTRLYVLLHPDTRHVQRSESLSESEEEVAGGEDVVTEDALDEPDAETGETLRAPRALVFPLEDLRLRG